MWHRRQFSPRWRSRRNRYRHRRPCISSRDRPQIPHRILFQIPLVFSTSYTIGRRRQQRRQRRRFSRTFPITTTIIIITTAGLLIVITRAEVMPVAITITAMAPTATTTATTMAVAIVIRQRPVIISRAATRHRRSTARWRGWCIFRRWRHRSLIPAHPSAPVHLGGHRHPRIPSRARFWIQLTGSNRRRCRPSLTDEIIRSWRNAGCTTAIS